VQSSMLKAAVTRNASTTRVIPNLRKGSKDKFGGIPTDPTTSILEADHIKFLTCKFLIGMSPSANSC
jgi:hypothetical protein